MKECKVGVPKTYNIPQKKWIIIFKLNPSKRRIVWGDTEEEVMGRMQQIKEKWEKRQKQKLEKVV